MEAYDFIKFYQGDFPRYFRKFKCFWLHPTIFVLVSQRQKPYLYHVKPLASRKSLEIYCQGKYEYS